jgi:hypothetical protein
MPKDDSRRNEAEYRLACYSFNLSKVLKEAAFDRYSIACYDHPKNRYSG